MCVKPGVKVGVKVWRVSRFQRVLRCLELEVLDSYMMDEIKCKKSEDHTRGVSKSAFACHAVVPAAGTSAPEYVLGSGVLGHDAALENTTLPLAPVT